MVEPVFVEGFYDEKGANLHDQSLPFIDLNYMTSHQKSRQKVSGSNGVLLDFRTVSSTMWR